MFSHNVVSEITLGIDRMCDCEDYSRTLLYDVVVFVRGFQSAHVHVHVHVYFCLQPFRTPVYKKHPMQVTANNGFIHAYLYMYMYMYM